MTYDLSRHILSGQNLFRWEKDELTTYMSQDEVTAEELDTVC